MAWQSQQYQGHEGLLRVPPPPSTEPDRPGHQQTTFDLSWDGEDTQPGIGPVRNPETQMPPNARLEPKEVERTNNLFVFGVCRSGFRLNVAVARDKGFVGATKTLPQFKMINMNDEVPAIIDGGETAIVGELYVVKNRTIEWLDNAVEDCPSSTARRIISLEDGTRAHCYILNRWKIPYREEVIPSGDWAEWKRAERPRVAERKRQFLDKMKKGKEEAEARRKALAESLNGKPGEFVSEYGARLWDPVTQKWKYVPAGQPLSPTQNGDPSGAAEQWRERMRQRNAANAQTADESKPVVKNTQTGKSMIHISNVPMISLRIKLRDGGHDPDGMTDSLVRIECMTRYGMWYDID
jgi:gamma-glutamylcyclotransferase (GGCT)/AIG2-like uncharacterized protein YtfP